MLKLTRVNVHYGDVQALRNVSFQIRGGEIVSIIGSNGAGKSTTLNAISGVLPCSSGTIEFMGKRIENLLPHQIVDEGLVQIPEGRLLFPYMTVLENLELGSFTTKARRSKEENLKGVFRLFPVLEERMGQLAGTLSGGEQQMVAIARGLMGKPNLLMLDEPSLGLMPKLVDEMLEAVAKLKESGKTILLVEQNVRESLELSDRGYVLQTGRTIHQGTGKELLTAEIIQKAFLGL